MARVYNRKEGTIPYVAGTMQTLELSRNYHVQRYILTIEAEITNGEAPIYYDDNLFKLISSLNLVANGSVNLKQIPAEKLIYNYLLNNGVRPYTQITKTASGTYLQKQTAIIDLVIPNELRPMDTVLNTRVFNSLNLNANWTDSAAAILGSDITINSATLHVSSEQLIGYSRNKGEKINYFKEVARGENVTSNNSNYLIKLDPNQFYIGFLVTAQKQNVLTDSVIKNIRIKSGTTIFMDLNAETVKRINENDMKIINQGSNTGLYYLDFTPRGKLTDMLNTVQSAGGFNTLELELEIANADASTYISVYSEFIEITNQLEVE
ncbi:MAG: hypothetical protein LBT96_05435 [Campylobacteraceae bacterium]|jgi:hypothetical protein|nr:hypothetical protein [Campylobacteraceae bacterium]